MSDEVTYFTNAETGYVPAKLGQRSSQQKPMRILQFVVQDVIPDVVKFIVCLIPLILNGLIGLILPPKKKSIVGQTALVTGGGNGLGRALCLRLAKEGCNVAVVDIDMVGAQRTVSDVRKLGVKAEAFLADIANYEEVEKLKLAVEDALGPVDILVNNAGLLAISSITEGKPSDLQRILNVNLLSHFWTIRAFKSGMIHRHRGHIVAIASIAAHFPVGRFIPYTVTKYGVRALMESLNSELRMDGLHEELHTTCVYPALIATRQQFMDLLDKLNFLHRFYVFTPKQVANQVVKGILANKRETIRVFIDEMKQRRSGYILAVSSILGYIPMARCIPYVGTKFALRGMMQALHNELKIDGYEGDIQATTLYPTFIATRKELMDLIRDVGLDEKIAFLTPEEVAKEAIDDLLPTAFTSLLIKTVTGKLPPLASRAKKDAQNSTQNQ